MPEPLLRKCIELLDRCDFELLDPKAPRGPRQCTRCQRKHGGPVDPLEIFLCDKGRRELIGYAFYCPGCDQAHQFYIKAPSDRPENDIWIFNGNVKKPSFSPSLRRVNEDGGHECHLSLVEGVIEYHEDCSHPFAGQKIPLRPYPQHAAS